MAAAAKGLFRGEKRVPARGDAPVWSRRLSGRVAARRSWSGSC